MAERERIWSWWTERAGHAIAVAGILIGLPLAIVTLKRAVRAALDLAGLLICLVLLRDGEGADVKGRRMEPGTWSGRARTPMVAMTAWRQTAARRRREWAAFRAARTRAAGAEWRAALSQYVAHGDAQANLAAAARYRARARRHLLRWLALVALPLVERGAPPCGR